MSWDRTCLFLRDCQFLQYTCGTARKRDPKLFTGRTNERQIETGNCVICLNPTVQNGRRVGTSMTKIFVCSEDCYRTWISYYKE
jgi:hypothetical protein